MCLELYCLNELVICSVGFELNRIIFKNFAHVPDQIRLAMPALADGRTAFDRQINVKESDRFSHFLENDVKILDIPNPIRHEESLRHKVS